MADAILDGYLRPAPPVTVAGRAAGGTLDGLLVRWGSANTVTPPPDAEVHLARMQAVTLASTATVQPSADAAALTAALVESGEIPALAALVAASSTIDVLAGVDVAALEARTTASDGTAGAPPDAFAVTTAAGQSDAYTPLAVAEARTDASATSDEPHSSRIDIAIATAGTVSTDAVDAAIFDAPAGAAGREAASVAAVAAMTTAATATDNGEGATVATTADFAVETGIAPTVDGSIATALLAQTEAASAGAAVLASTDMIDTQVADALAALASTTTAEDQILVPLFVALTLVRLNTSAAWSGTEAPHAATATIGDRATAEDAATALERLTTGVSATFRIIVRRTQDLALGPVGTLKLTSGVLGVLGAEGERDLTEPPWSLIGDGRAFRVRVAGVQRDLGPADGLVLRMPGHRK